MFVSVGVHFGERLALFTYESVIEDRQAPACIYSGVPLLTKWEKDDENEMAYSKHPFFNPHAGVQPEFH